MIVGFNHNISYRGVTFHVQTEDSGVKSSQLVTLLYHGGTIIASQKTVYADIIKVENLNQVVEDLAKEQHKGMLRRLTKGEFDQRISDLGIELAPPTGRGAPAAPVEEPETVQEVKAEDVADAPAPESPHDLPEALPVAPEAAEPVTIVEEPVVDKFRKPAKPEPSLDDLILAYLLAESGD